MLRTLETAGFWLRHSDQFPDTAQPGRTRQNKKQACKEDACFKIDNPVLTEVHFFHLNFRQTYRLRYVYFIAEVLGILAGILIKEVLHFLNIIGFPKTGTGFPILGRVNPVYF